jgi:protoporphyrinogen oxidase
VIGGGLAGLAAARDLGRLGAEVVVLEAAGELGGLASSISIGGRRIERFYHFVCGGDDDLTGLLGEVGISHQLHWREAKTAFFHEGKLYSFGTPLDLLRFRPVPIQQRLRFGLSIVGSRRRRDWHRLDGVSAKRWLIDRVGQQAYQVIWDPLLRVKFGDYHEQVSAAWIWHRIIRLAASRRHLWEREHLGYLESGTEALVGKLHALLTSMPNVGVRLGTRVEKVLAAGGRVVGLELSTGEVIDCQVVVSTIALAALIGLVQGFDDEYRHRLSRIDYIGVVCGLLKLREPVTDNFWLNINDPRVPFNGIIEYTNLNQHLRAAIGDRSIVYVPCYMRTDCRRYRLGDDVLRQEFLDGLALINPRFKANWVEDCLISREPFAQAICTVGFANLVPDHRSPLAGLYLTDSTQYYPEDRTVSAAIRLGRRVAQLIETDTTDLVGAPRCP